MKHWFRDRHFRSLLKNTGYLAISKAVAGVAGLATLAFAGRGLGLALFGMLVLIHSYAQAAAGLTKFQSWQLIVRYGGNALREGDKSQFKDATGFALGLDLASGFGGMLLAIALLPLIGNWFGITDGYIWLAMLYCTLLPTMGSATPVGVLRSLDRFDLLSWQGTSYPIARAILAGIAFLSDAPFVVYLAIWYATDMGGDLFLWFLAWREMKRRNLLSGIRPTLRPARLPGAWRFAIHVNLTGSITVALGPVARLIVGGLVGPSGAALFRVASTLADSAQKPANMLAKAFYPEVVRMDLSTKKPWKLMLRGIALASSIAIAVIALLVIGGEALVGALLGREFLPAYPILLVLVLAPLVGIFTFGLPSMLYALDRPDAPLKAKIAGALVYLAAVVPLTLQFGVIGAAVAYVICFATTALILIAQLGREYRRVRAVPR
jgi:O-antigen/teichoic acid export membrane protein